tara:strand:- start:100 stop:513 length:414 start_codon:yes stop_codon:yes gene_type:complete
MKSVKDLLKISLDRITHPIITKMNTPDTKYGKHGRVWMLKKNGVWSLKNHKDIKKVTPDDMFKSGDSIVLNDVKSITFGHLLDGNYDFDSYDSWDNICYVKASNTSGAMTYAITLNDLYKDNITIDDLLRGYRKNKK